MEHFFQDIQGWFNFDGVYHQAVQRAESPAHFVEVGAWKGKSAAYLAVEIINSGKQIQLDIVDTWEGSKEHQHDPEVVNQTLYEEFLTNMKPVEGHYRALRMTSLEAAELYTDESLDLVLIDASHEYLDVKADIQAWLPKVKQGGILAGDDLPWPGVNQAVTELLTYHERHGAYWLLRK
jgi:predicted O-methyltransferase YrrM